MKKVNHKKLLALSNDKTLFRRELTNMVNALDKETRFDLMAYCYKHFSDLFPDVLLEVFYPDKNPDIKIQSDKVLDQQHNIVTKGPAKSETG